jgi:hypothetical protein
MTRTHAVGLLHEECASLCMRAADEKSDTCAFVDDATDFPRLLAAVSPSID